MGSPTIAALFAQRVVVGVGELSVSNNPGITLSTYALGSCVAVVAYDPFAKAAGKAATQPAMFADTGLPLLLRSMVGLRADFSRLRVFLAGGANVLCANDTFKIGERNIRATLDYARQQNLMICHSALGGTINRTVHLSIGTGAITLKTGDVNEAFSLG
jgi:chemotaxis protein CheD